MDKEGTEAYGDAKSNATGILDSGRQGFGLARSAFNVASLPVRLAGRTAAAGGGALASRVIGKEAAEKRSIRSAMKNGYIDANGINQFGNDWKNMSNYQKHNLFQSTKTAQDLKAAGKLPGSAEYDAAFNHFKQMSKRGAVNELLGGTSLSQRQDNIRNNRTFKTTLPVFGSQLDIRTLDKTIKNSNH